MSAIGAPAAARPRAGAGATARAGLAAGAASAVAAVALLALIAEIAATPTSAPGIDSSTWTPPTAVTAVIFGPGAFHGSLVLWSVAVGLAAMLAAGALLGVLGAAWIVACAGPAPSPGLALALGVAFGLVAEVAVVNVGVTAIDDDALLYEALPSWGWWIAFALYGATLGLLLARRGRRAR